MGGLRGPGFGRHALATSLNLDDHSKITTFKGNVYTMPLFANFQVWGEIAAQLENNLKNTIASLFPPQKIANRLSTKRCQLHFTHKRVNFTPGGKNCPH